MNKRVWTKVLIGAAGAVAGVYAIFLLSPLILNPIIEGYIPQINGEIHKATGLVSKLEGVKVVTTPKLTAGLKVKRFTLLTPDNEQVFDSNDFQVKMSLIPLLARKIEIDIVSLENVDIDLKINNDGSFEIEKYFPQEEKNQNNEEVKPQNLSLPLGLKFSNHLPDIKSGGYNITFINGDDKYIISGDKTEITDFILNKSVRVKASGKAVFKDREQFKYNLSVLNKIMPDIELNDLITTPQAAEEAQKESEPVNITEIFKGLYKSRLCANADTDLIIAREGINGKAVVTNLSILNLPPSDVNVEFKGNSINILSNIYTEKNELSKIDGLIKIGKHPKIDMNFKSKAEIANVLRIVKDIAEIFNNKDLQTLSAQGRIDADFNLKSDLKTVKSNGYLKIPSAEVYYGLYKVGVDNINVDTELNNNNINIKNIGFSVFNQPLKFYGTISEDAVSDLHLTADKLNLKGLLVALGQGALLKDNNINSGLISLNADITGRLDKINPLIKLSINNIDIKNTPSNTTLKAPSTVVNITSDGKTFSGDAQSADVYIINPAAKISIPKINANIREKEIEITKTPVQIEKINATVSGKIQNYLTEKIGLHFLTTGDIKSTLSGDMNLNKQTLNLLYHTNELSTIIIPMFDKSKMSFIGNIQITGNMMNPTLKGDVQVPSLNIPEIPVTMNNLNINLDGHILNGSASLAKFTSGGIEAENLTGDFELKGNDFYLTNLKGSAFLGTIAGNIKYNLANAKTTIDFSGANMDAAKAVAGAVGIKNALSGTLGFDAKLDMLIADYEDMMKSLNGNVTFSVKNGAFGSIGRIDKFLNASNIITNSILKTTVATLTNNAGLAETAKFDYINGVLSFKNGWADIKEIKSSGKYLAYYIFGKYNLVNGTTNVTILGRLESTMVTKLGPIGELSADKLLGYIPKFGALTANIVNALTENPKGENIEAIPALTGGSTSYKDFKVLFNGGLESTSSVKSFKWLTDVDTSAIETKTIKETVEEIKQSVNEDLTNTVKSVSDAVNNSKEQWAETKEQLKNSAEELKNLFKSFTKPSTNSSTSVNES